MVLLRDSRGEIAGLLRLDTSVGPVAFIFRDEAKLRRFVGAMAEAERAPGYGYAWFSLDAASFPEAVEKVLALDPSMAGTLSFFPDTDKLFPELLDSLSNMKGTIDP